MCPSGKDYKSKAGAVNVSYGILYFLGWLIVLTVNCFIMGITAVYGVACEMGG